jgi:hypothetical protein
LPTGRSRALLWLPPVVIAIALGLLLSRVATRRGDREPLERAIRAHWEVPDEAAAVESELAEWQTSYGADPAARWFAAEAWIRLGRLGKALEAVWPAGTGTPEADDPEASRRFALLALGILGSPPGEPTTLGPLAGRTLQARIESGDPAAAAELKEAVRGMTFQQLAGFFLNFVRSPTRAIQALRAALEARASEPDVLALAATLPPSPSEGPALDLLLDRLESPWRFGRRGPWQYVVRALGASPAPKALAALRAAHASIGNPAGAAGAPATGLDLAGGLAIAGDAEAIARVEAESLGGRSLWLAEMYVGGLLARVMAGDAEAGTRLAQLHDKTAAQGLQLQIAFGVVFADAEPLPTIPADRFAEAVGMSREPMQRVIAHAWALRRGRPGARAALLEDVRGAPEGQELRGTRVDAYGPVAAPMEALRALARWSVPAGK